MDSVLSAHHPVNAHMKYFIFSVVLALVFAFTRDPESDQNRKAPLSWSVEYSKPDTRIRPSQALVQFTFNTETNSLVALKDSVLLSYNGTKKTVHCDTLGRASILIQPGKYKFQFWHDNMTFEIYTDSIEIKGAHATGMLVNFLRADYQLEADKPVIYFYPQATTHVHVTLDVKGQLGFTYPEYTTNLSDSTIPGWTFAADPNGTLHIDGKEYNYLFWDAHISLSAERAKEKEGFIVQRDSLVPFFERTLTQMNLSPREKEDFITYWCPQMQKHDSCVVHFQFNDDYNSIAGINITPNPDNLFRVFMTWEDAAMIDHSNIKPQKIESVKREGFTVVEWGGGEIRGGEL